MTMSLSNAIEYILYSISVSTWITANVFKEIF